MLSAAVMLLAAAALLPAAEGGRPTIIVEMRVEPGVRLDAGSLRALAQEARDIWKPVLDVAIVAPDAAPRSVVVDTLRLTVTSRLLSNGEGSGLGWVQFVEGEPKGEITVSEGAARRLLQGGHWRGTPFSSLPPAASRLFLERALARAVAHEIGHYLLRTTAHDKRGLMRAVFTAEEIMDARPELVRLSPEAAARLGASRAAVARAGEAGAAEVRN